MAVYAADLHSLIPPHFHVDAPPTYEFPRLDTSDMMRGNCSKISIPAYWSAPFPDTARFNVDVGLVFTHIGEKISCEFPRLETPDRMGIVLGSPTRCHRDPHQ